MNEREKIIRLWFDMWLNQQDMGIDDIFAEDVIYTESWSPQYNNRKTVKHWFQEWNTRGKVVVWKIKQFFHKGDCKFRAQSSTCTENEPRSHKDLAPPSRMRGPR